MAAAQLRLNEGEFLGISRVVIVRPLTAPQYGAFSFDCGWCKFVASLCWLRRGHQKDGRCREAFRAQALFSDWCASQGKWEIVEVEGSPDSGVSQVGVLSQERILGQEGPGSGSSCVKGVPGSRGP